MTRVLLWKELREQWTTALALAALGVAVLVSIPLFSMPKATPGDEAGAVMAICLAWMCGLIVGAQTLAGEREAGTLPWLDSLPATRRQVWAGKSLFAAAAVGVQAAVLLAVAAWYGYV